jgi:hypothetical protein
VRRESHDRVSADDRPRVRRQQVVLPDMNTRRSREPGDVCTIVDDQPGARGPGILTDRGRELEERAAFQLLRAQLQQARATGQIGAREIARRPSGGRRDAGVDDGVKRRKRNQADSASEGACLGRA